MRTHLLYIRDLFIFCSHTFGAHSLCLKSWRTHIICLLLLYFIAYFYFAFTLLAHIIVCLFIFCFWRDSILCLCLYFVLELSRFYLVCAHFIMYTRFIYIVLSHFWRTFTLLKIMAHTYNLLDFIIFHCLFLFCFYAFGAHSLLIYFLFLA